MLTKEYLENKIKNLESQLTIAKDKLYKMTPQIPIINDECHFDENTNVKDLVHKYTYFCAYCGEQVRLNTKKHKCGQVQDWSFLTR